MADDGKKKPEDNVPDAPLIVPPLPKEALEPQAEELNEEPAAALEEDEAPAFSEEDEHLAELAAQFDQNQEEAEDLPPPDEPPEDLIAAAAPAKPPLPPKKVKSPVKPEDVAAPAAPESDDELDVDEDEPGLEDEAENEEEVLVEDEDEPTFEDELENEEEEVLVEDEAVTEASTLENEEEEKKGAEEKKKSAEQLSAEQKEERDLELKAAGLEAEKHSWQDKRKKRIQDFEKSSMGKSLKDFSSKLQKAERLSEDELLAVALHNILLMLFALLSGVTNVSKKGVKALFKKQERKHLYSAELRNFARKEHKKILPKAKRLQKELFGKNGMGGLKAKKNELKKELEDIQSSSVITEEGEKRIKAIEKEIKAITKKEKRYEAMLLRLAADERICRTHADATKDEEYRKAKEDRIAVLKELKEARKEYREAKGAVAGASYFQRDAKKEEVGLEDKKARVERLRAKELDLYQKMESLEKKIGQTSVAVDKMVSARQGVKFDGMDKAQEKDGILSQASDKLLKASNQAFVLAERKVELEQERKELEEKSKEKLTDKQKGELKVNQDEVAEQLKEVEGKITANEAETENIKKEIRALGVDPEDMQELYRDLDVESLGLEENEEETLEEAPDEVLEVSNDEEEDQELEEALEEEPEVEFDVQNEEEEQELEDKFEAEEFEEEEEDLKVAAEPALAQQAPPPAPAPATAPPQPAAPGAPAAQLVSVDALKAKMQERELKQQQKLAGYDGVLEGLNNMKPLNQNNLKDTLGYMMMQGAMLENKNQVSDLFEKTKGVFQPSMLDSNDDKQRQLGYFAVISQAYRLNKPEQDQKKPLSEEELKMLQMVAGEVANNKPTVKDMTDNRLQMKIDKVKAEVKVKANVFTPQSQVAEPSAAQQGEVGAEMGPEEDAKKKGRRGSLT